MSFLGGGSRHFGFCFRWHLRVGSSNMCPSLGLSIFLAFLRRGAARRFLLACWVEVVGTWWRRIGPTLCRTRKWEAISVAWFGPEGGGASSRQWDRWWAWCCGPLGFAYVIGRCKTRYRLLWELWRLQIPRKHCALTKPGLNPLSWSASLEGPRNCLSNPLTKIMTF